jgi:hypothetical protein
VSELKDGIQAGIRESLKSGDKVRLSTLRLLSAAVKNREIEVLRELDDDEVREVAVKEAKRRKEAIEAYEVGGRLELADKEKAELELLQVYLPEQLSEAEVDALIEEAVALTGASSMKEMGKVMGAVMAKAKGKADGTQIQAKVRARLSGE